MVSVGTKPIPKPSVDLLSMDPLEQTSMKSESQYYDFIDCSQNDIS